MSEPSNWPPSWYNPSDTGQHVFISATVIGLQELAVEQPTLFGYLVDYVRGGNVNPIDESRAEVLRDFGLVGQGANRLHDMTRDVILASLVGEGHQMQIVDPRQPT